MFIGKILLDSTQAPREFPTVRFFALTDLAGRL